MVQFDNKKRFLQNLQGEKAFIAAQGIDADILTLCVILTK